MCLINEIPYNGDPKKIHIGYVLMFKTLEDNVFESRYSRAYYSDEEPVYKLGKWYSAGYYPNARIEYDDTLMSHTPPGFHAYIDNQHVIKFIIAGLEQFECYDELVVVKAEFKHLISHGIEKVGGHKCFRASHRRIIEVVFPDPNTSILKEA